MRTIRVDSSTRTGGRGSSASGDAPPAAPSKARSRRATTKRRLVHFDNADYGRPASAGGQGYPGVPDEPAEWLDHCEARAREVLRRHGVPDDLGPWHRTPQGEWRQPRHASLEDYVSFPEPFATLESLLEPKPGEPPSACWFAAWMLRHVEGARDALAAGDAVNAFLNGARLAMWADHLDLELTGHRKAAEVGDAQGRNGRNSNRERQDLIETWLEREAELAAAEPELGFNERARRIASEVKQKYATVRHALLRRRKKLRFSPG